MSNGGIHVPQLQHLRVRSNCDANDLGPRINPITTPLRYLSPLLIYFSCNVSSSSLPPLSSLSSLLNQMSQLVTLRIDRHYFFAPSQDELNHEDEQLDWREQQEDENNGILLPRRQRRPRLNHGEVSERMLLNPS